MYNLGEIINTHILWIVPIITIILTFIVIILSMPDNEHLNLKDLLSVGINLSISAITILITNYKSSTTAWLILFFFIVTLLLAIATRKFMWNRSTLYKIIACILFILVGLFLSHIAIEHATDHIQNIIP